VNKAIITTLAAATLKPATKFLKRVLRNSSTREKNKPGKKDICKSILQEKYLYNE
jgi:hypothetical protein